MEGKKKKDIKSHATQILDNGDANRRSVYQEVPLYLLDPLSRDEKKPTPA